MHLGSCIILLCLGHVYVPTMLLVDTADDDSQSRDSETWDEFQRSHEAAFTAGQSNYYCGSSSRSNDPDDELVIVGSSKSDEIRYFNPVDEFWQYEKCRQLNLQPEVYFQFNRPVKILNSPLQWIDVVPDGNCFYRALSYWVSGTEDNHLAIRLRVLEIVRTDQRILEFQGEENYREHLIWLSQNSWATEVEIVAATLLLDTPIYVYSQRNRTWDLFDQNKKSKGPLTKTDKCIYIQHILGVHYNLVTDVISDQDLAGDDPDAINSRMWDEYRRTYLHNQAGFAGESTGSKINDPDDRLSMVGSSTSDEVGYFNPVDQFWQYQMCRQLKMDLENYFQFNQVVKILNFPLQWVAVTPDQNCFYRALSFWVSGTEDNHLIVRLRVLEIVRTDQRIMEYLGEENYRAHLIWLSQNSWATEVEIVAATLLLNTPIYVYSQQNRTWDLYDQNKKYKSPLTKTDKCIYIQHISGIHYNLVTDVVSDQDQGYMSNPASAAAPDHGIENPVSIERSQQEEFRMFYPVDEAWQYDKCFKWDLTLEKPFKYIQMPTFLNTPKKCVKMQRDKNSFFRAISYCVTGTEINHQIFRKYVAREILFNRAIQKLYKENEFISCNIQNTWATKIEIIASAVLLDTSIFIYSHDTQTWDVYNKNIIDNVPVDTSFEKCIYLRQKSPNVYDVVQDVEHRGYF